ncbi:MAG: hypothetical protein IPK21_22875 [Haliscomenobacter sp.]|nr:hypothetical protein [Haliscomenobacter sp.]
MDINALLTLYRRAPDAGLFNGLQNMVIDKFLLRFLSRSGIFFARGLRPWPPSP